MNTKDLRGILEEIRTKGTIEDKESLKNALRYMKTMYSAKLISDSLQNNADFTSQIQGVRNNISDFGLDQETLEMYMNQLEELESTVGSPDALISFMTKESPNFLSGAKKEDLIELCAQSINQSLNGVKVVNPSRFNPDIASRYLSLANSPALNEAVEYVNVKEKFISERDDMQRVEDFLPYLQDIVSQFDTQEFQDLQAALQERDRINGKYLEKSDESSIGKFIRNIRKTFSKRRDEKEREAIEGQIKSKIEDPNYQKAVVAMYSIGCISEFKNPVAYLADPSVGGLAREVILNGTLPSNVKLGPAKMDKTSIVNKINHEVDSRRRSYSENQQAYESARESLSQEARDIVDQYRPKEIKDLAAWDSLEKNSDKALISPACATLVLGMITENNPDRMKEILGAESKGIFNPENTKKVEKHISDLIKKIEKDAKKDINAKKEIDD